MKITTVFLSSLIVLFTAGCAARPRHVVAPIAAVAPPAADDWTTEYEGTGSVRTSITNASHRALFLKVRQEAVVAAQVKLEDDGTRDVNLAPGAYSTVMELGPNTYYRGPRFSIPSNTAHMMLRLQVSTNKSNLTRTTKADFER